eukprot:gene11121-biopygen8958
MQALVIGCARSTWGIRTHRRNSRRAAPPDAEPGDEEHVHGRLPGEARPQEGRGGTGGRRHALRLPEELAELTSQHKAGAHREPPAAGGGRGRRGHRAGL